MRKVVAIVPARAGSKGIPDKNIMQIGGKALIEWAIKIGTESPLVCDTYISTDSAKYEKLALASGAKSLGLRPKHLGEDNTKTVDVVLDMLVAFEKQGVCYDLILLLQPTAPERSVEQVAALIDCFDRAEANAAVSVSLLDEPHPYKLKKISSDGWIEPFLGGQSSENSRQTLDQAHRLTGAYYLVKVDALKESRSFFPPRTAAFVTYPVVNIDAQADADYLRYLVETGKDNLPK
ncbi:MAG: acylneuraminate cytidylyltransferase family protein [Alphaproteobacteria bacterium]|nr:acylneuraminate cytidylyltransferase family protein [Alphaproteobacteria bacterium]